MEDKIFDNHIHTIITNKYRELLDRRSKVAEEIHRLDFEIECYEKNLEVAKNAVGEYTKELIEAIGPNGGSLKDSYDPYEELKDMVIMCGQGDVRPLFSEDYLGDIIGKAGTKKVLIALNKIYELAGKKGEF